MKQDTFADEFITTDEDDLSNSAELLQPSESNSSQLSDVGSLHKLEEIPHIKDQKQIKMGADTKVMKQMARDELINSEVDQIRKKMASVPKTPIDILKELIAKGSFTKDFELFDHIWTIRSLDQADYIQIFDESDALAETSGRFESLKLVSIAYSIEALDGIPVYDWFPGDITLAQFNNDKQKFMLAIRRAVRRYLEVNARSTLSTLYEKVQEVEILQSKAVSEIKNS